MKYFMHKNIDIKSSNILYRYTAYGEGIYEAFRVRVFGNVWHNFLHSKAATWLPKPPIGTYSGYDSYESYFTENGRIMFEKYTLPVIKQYIHNEDITLHKVDKEINGDIVYQDKYQIIYGINT